MMILEGEGVRKKYGSLEVLKGVDISVKQGEIVAIVGASGAGKTTLLQILSTLDRPNAGKVVFSGEDITRYSERQLSNFRNREIGFVFQFHHLLPEFTALENVCIPAYIRGKGKKESIARAKNLLEQIGLEERMNHKPNQLSGGENQRVAIARALINSPKVIFADEPTGNLDSKNKEDLHKLIFELRDKMKQTFVIVTHDVSFANQADRKFVMKDGLIIDE